MSVKVTISSLLKKLTDGQETVEVSGHTLLECLQGVESKIPEIRKWVYDKEGKLRPQIWFFVNGEKLNADELTRTLNDGDEVSILLAISGG